MSYEPNWNKTPFITSYCFSGGGSLVSTVAEARVLSDRDRDVRLVKELFHS